MNQRGLSDPYVRLTESPASGHTRRHKHPHYRLEPLQAEPALGDDS